MSCGRTHLTSRIRLLRHVASNPEWKCKPSCLTCKYWEICYYEMMCETGEVSTNLVYEYRVRTENSAFITGNYGDALDRFNEWLNDGLEARLERREMSSSKPWVIIM